ncbi:MAG: hypothetical protein Q7T82_09380 [Armatimonadota bacterium]|nr:hypothetical protein [Armatimonadota bacterium]
MTSEQFMHSNYEIRRKFLKLFGGSYYILNGLGDEVMFASLKAFKLKEDITIYTGRDMQTEVLKIRARQILDFSATYDVTDAATDEKVGALRRKGLKSAFLKDEWLLLDNLDNEVGVIREDNALLALVRRWLTNLIPQKYHAEMNGNQVCTFKQNFNPFSLRLAIDFSPDMRGQLDRRLGIAAGILLSAIEGRQQ